ncbi:MAG: hypothetical protein H0T62_09990 [Parachlamydiaceae bacterium]|nr:hypothetical protein [Parachlamydiaceae bacterium]
MSNSEMPDLNRHTSQVSTDHPAISPSSNDKKGREIYSSAAPISETGETILKSGNGNDKIKNNEHQIVKMPTERLNEETATPEKGTESISFLFKRFTVTDYSQKSPEVMAKHNAVVVRFPH